MPASSSIDDYLSSVPGEMREALEDLRKTIAKAAPEATEAISYQMPTFKYKGKGLVAFAAFKSHCSLFPMGSGVLDAYEKELASFRTSKGTLQFTPAKPIGKGLVKKIVKARMQEIDAKRK